MLKNLDLIQNYVKLMNELFIFYVLFSSLIIYFLLFIYILRGEARTVYGIRTIAPRKIAARLGLGFGFGIGSILGLGAIFLEGNCPSLYVGLAKKKQTKIESLIPDLT